MTRQPVRALIAPVAMCVAVTLLVGCAPPSAGLEPTALRVEYLANPLAIDAPKPRLTWEFVQVGARGARQTAWRVLAASRPDILTAGRGDGSHLQYRLIQQNFEPA